MKVRFWGVRGSLPTPGPSTVKYGGNTSCLEVRGDNDEVLVVDCGTGARELGNYLIANDLKKGPLKLNIFLSHTHWDHIQGFPFFGPAYIASTEITFRGPTNFSGKLEDIVAGQMQYSYYPVKLDELKSIIKFEELQETSFEIGNFKITTKYLNHPILCLGYRIEHNGKVFATIYDHEPYRNIFASEKPEESDVEIDEESLKEAEEFVNKENEKIINHIKDADLVVYDAQYKKEEYETKKGWGHSTIDHALEAGIKSGSKKIALFHHDPLRSDKQLDEIQSYAISTKKEMAPENDLIVFVARERLEVTL